MSSPFLKSTVTDFTRVCRAGPGVPGTPGKDIFKKCSLGDPAGSWRRKVQLDGGGAGRPGIIFYKKMSRIHVVISVILYQ